MGSGQPSTVWATKIYIGNTENRSSLKMIGHGHPSGQNGEVYSDLSTLDNALEIIESIQVSYILEK